MGLLTRSGRSTGVLVLLSTAKHKAAVPWCFGQREEHISVPLACLVHFRFGSLFRTFISLRKNMETHSGSFYSATKTLHSHG
uniref:Putative secreted protein n=1 Tax=Anopheles marajoara TaxID=58244 RepID=A0A2M4CBM8_9DIPT